LGEARRVRAHGSRRSGPAFRRRAGSRRERVGVRPELFRIFEISFPAYFLFLLSGFLFATASGALWARRIGKNPDVIVDLGLACLLFGVIGGRLLHVFADGYFMDYVHLCTDPSRVDWPAESATVCVNRLHGVWDAARGVCHPPMPTTFWERV